MPSSPNTEIGPDFRDMLGLLFKHGVDFLLIGGHAMGAHEIPRFTHDIDFLVRPSVDNAKRLWNALGEFGAPLGRLSVDDFAVPRYFVQFGVTPNRIDFATSIQGVAFDEAWASRVYAPFAGMTVPVLSVEHLIRNKLAVARDKDLIDVKSLQRKIDAMKLKSAPPAPKTDSR